MLAYLFPSKTVEQPIISPPPVENTNLDSERKKTATVGQQHIRGALDASTITFLPANEQSEVSLAHSTRSIKKTPQQTTKPKEGIDLVFHTIQSSPILTGAAVAAVTNLIFARTFFGKLNFLLPSATGACLAATLPQALPSAEKLVETHINTSTNEKIKSIAPHLMNLIQMIKTPIGQLATIAVASRIISLIPYGPETFVALSIIPTALAVKDFLKTEEPTPQVQTSERNPSSTLNKRTTLQRNEGRATIQTKAVLTEQKRPSSQPQLIIEEGEIFSEELSREAIDLLFKTLANKKTEDSDVNSTFEKLLSEIDNFQDFALQKRLLTFYSKNKEYFDSKLEEDLIGRLDAM